MQTVKIIFFGSTDDSVIVLSALYALVIGPPAGGWSLEIACVVTQPPRAVGRKQTMTPTPVEAWAKEHIIPVLSFASAAEKSWAYADEHQVIDTLQPFKADLIVSACYGQKIPQKTIRDAAFGGLNVHPSLLPRWRGADPVPWALFSGDHQTGVTVVTLSDTFDTGTIIARKKMSITDTDTSDPLRTKLFTLGAELLAKYLPSYLDHKPVTRHSSPPSPSPYARRLSRDDGFESWEAIQKAFIDPNEAQRLDRKFRAFFPWPGVWTTIQVKSEEKRLKILSLHLQPTTYNLQFDTVQLEGKNPVSWTQFQDAYLPS
ncbi:MAG: methionyl-tRNA formyltransferase [Candidatus Gottesmanbacteria bacterium]|nr:methionyl-tRNA formyltransferase [Candidatus Gottesmanbacteria bacterium]